MTLTEVLSFKKSSFNGLSLCKARFLSQVEILQKAFLNWIIQHYAETKMGIFLPWTGWLAFEQFVEGGKGINLE